MKPRLRKVWWPAAGVFVWQLLDDRPTVQRYTFDEICRVAREDSAYRRRAQPTNMAYA